MAYARNPHLTPPVKALSSDSFDADPAILVEQDKPGSPLVAILSVRFLLPIPFSGTFTLGNIEVGPLDYLERAVDEVCSLCSYDRMKLAQSSMDQVDDSATFSEVALYGTHIFAKLVDEARNRNLPLILDY